MRLLLARRGRRWRSRRARRCSWAVVCLPLRLVVAEQGAGRALLEEEPREVQGSGLAQQGESTEWDSGQAEQEAREEG
jgi:hypothetical protein